MSAQLVLWVKIDRGKRPISHNAIHYGRVRLVYNRTVCNRYTHTKVYSRRKRFFRAYQTQSVGWMFTVFLHISFVRRYRQKCTLAENVSVRVLNFRKLAPISAPGFNELRYA